MRVLRRQGGDDMLSCRQVGKVLQSFLDGEADQMTTEKVEVHLDMCRRCGMEADVYRRMKESLARAGSEVPETTLRRLRRFGEQLVSSEDHDGHEPEES